MYRISLTQIRKMRKTISIFIYSLFTNNERFDSVWCNVKFQVIPETFYNLNECSLDPILILFFCSGCIDIISNFLLAVAELEERYWLVDFLISSFASFYQQPCILYFETEDFSLWCLQFTARNMKMCAFDK